MRPLSVRLRISHSRLNNWLPKINVHHSKLNNWLLKSKFKIIRHIKFLNSPPFAWKISNSQVAYQRIVNRGENIIRSTFYLSSTGTDWESKFCRMLFLPVPSGPHSLLSCLINPFLFISVLILGNFNAILSWPFKEKVWVTLINQNPCKDEEKDVWRVSDFGGLVMPIMRPLVKDGQGRNDVLDPIHNKTSQSASFELNDTIFIMVKKE